MAWEWVAPVVTGVVGVAGIIGTGATARSARRTAQALADSSQREARQLTLRDERRTAYVEFLRAVSNADAEVPNVAVLQSGSGGSTVEAFEKIHRALYDLDEKNSLVRIVGDKAVRDAAERVRIDVVEKLELASKGDGYKTVSRPLRLKLEVAMRADLGHAAGKSRAQLDEGADSLRTGDST